LGILTTIIIAIGLSVDSFAVSITCGLVKTKIVFKEAIKIALSLAFFQGAFTFIGWLFGFSIRDHILIFDHWIAFVLLSFIGIHMIYESRKAENKKIINPLKLKVLIGLSIATSIDALIIGISFAFLETNIIITTLIIGLITFIASMLGILFGKKTGGRLGEKMEIVGGIVLILIGIKILVEHLFFQ